MKLPYSEGSAFVLPLRDGGWARGVVTRATNRGRVLFGYFFGPTLSSVKEASFEGLKPDGAILRLMFGDLGLITGKWQVLGSLPDWNRNDWPMPRFISRRGMAGNGKSYLIEYSDTDPNREEARWVIDHDPDLPKDSLSGAGAVEIKLSSLLQVGESNPSN